MVCSFCGAVWSEKNKIELQDASVVSIAIHSCRIDGGLKQQVGSIANVLFALGKEICRKRA